MNSLHPSPSSRTPFGQPCRRLAYVVRCRLLLAGRFAAVLFWLVALSPQNSVVENWQVEEHLCFISLYIFKTSLFHKWRTEKLISETGMAQCSSDLSVWNPSHVFTRGSQTWWIMMVTPPLTESEFLGARPRTLNFSEAPKWLNDQLA